MRVGRVVRPVRSPVVPALSTLIDFVKADLPKLLRYVAVSVITVPLGTILLWVFLRSDMKPVLAAIASFVLATIPNYLLNRYWVWNKRSANSVRSEVVPFFILALMGLILSTIFVAVADIFTDADIVFLALNFMAFGIVWVFKFFVLEKYLFADAESVEMAAGTT